MTPSRREVLGGTGLALLLAGCSQRFGDVGGSSGATESKPSDVSGTNVDRYFHDGTLTAPVETERMNHVRWVQPTDGGGIGANGPPSPDPYTLDESVLDGFQGRLVLHKGHWVTSGLVTDRDLDWDRSPVAIEGDGVWVTTVEHEDGTSPTVTLQASKGNGGAVRNIGVYGAGEGVGDAPVLEAGPNPYDHVIENAIVRYGGGDAVYLRASASGTRLRNCWLENSGGWGLRIDGGTRVKVSDVHFAGTHGGITHNGMYGNFADLTVFDARGGTGVQFTSQGNTLTNFVMKGRLKHGVHVATGGQHTAVSTGYLVDMNESAVTVSGMDSDVTNVTAKNWGGEKSWTPLLRLLGDGTTATGIWGVRSDPRYSSVLARIEADHCHVNGLGGDPSVDWEIHVESNATETVIDGLSGVAYENVDDTGTRTLVNRWGTNEGDPTRTGQWHGHADYAGRMNATIWDSTTSPWTPHRAAPDGSSWVAL